MSEYRRPQIGDVFYIIKRSAEKTYRFTRTCRVCEGKKELTVNGITFRCPKCAEETTTLQVSGFEVRCYKVFQVTEKADNAFWKLPRNKDGNISTYKSYKLFHKNRRGADYNPDLEDRSERIFSHDCPYFNCTAVDVLNKVIENPNSATSLHCDCIYDDYKLAVKVADALSEKEMERVKVYNEKNGTSYEVPSLYCEHEKKTC